MSKLWRGHQYLSVGLRRAQLGLGPRYLSVGLSRAQLGLGLGPLSVSSTCPFEVKQSPLFVLWDL